MITVYPKAGKPKTFKGKPLYFGSVGAQRVPCGKCAFCLTNKRLEWAFRIYYEMRTQNYPGYFLTFTYDEKHVRRAPSGLSLRFRDIQLYLKRLRKAKYYGKYICVGEYGSRTFRPHYHMLLWTDAPVDFLQANWKSSTTGMPMGAVHFGNISMRSAMYCLKYIIQPKQKAVDGFEKTRAQFSKGIGLNYLTAEVYDYHTYDYDEPIMLASYEDKKMVLPRYYRRKIFTKYQLKKEAEKNKWNSIREKRKLMRSLLRQGIRDTKNYMHALRIEKARKILSKTKYTEVL